MNRVRFVVRFYLPLLVGIGVLITIPAFRNAIAHATTQGRSTDIPLPLGLSFLGLPVLSISIPLSKVWLGSIGLPLLEFILPTVLFLYAINIDLSKYFPSKLDMHVLFDQEGIEEALERLRLTGKRQRKHNIPTEWRNLTDTYDNFIRTSFEELGKRLFDDEPPFKPAHIQREMLSANGNTTYSIRRTHPFQYRIEQGAGALEHSISIPSEAQFNFSTAFELQSTNGEYIRPKLTDFVFSFFRWFVIFPRFKQFLLMRDGPWELRNFNHTIIGASQLKLFPFPSIGATVYFWEMDELMVPIAYGVLTTAKN